jgi:hypothetical protein
MRNSIVAKMSNKLYKIMHDFDLEVARIEPSQYLLMLPPEEAVDELSIQIQGLNEEFQRYEQAFMRDELVAAKLLKGYAAWF